MQFWLATVAGLSLLFGGAGETFMAVLFPRAVNGPVAATINRLFHVLLKFRWLARSRLVVAAGPGMMVMQVLVWAAMLWVGVALIVWPQLGGAITSTGSEPTSTDFATALYYSGFTLTTLGTGDLIPRTSAMRMLTTTAAGLGFSFFTLVLAYVISVYSTLARRNRFANEIEYRTGRTGDSVGYLQAYLTASDASLVNQDLYTLASNMAELLESHHFYPVLHYFRFREPRYAMSRMLRFCLEVSSMMRAAHTIAPDQIASTPEASNRLWHASMQMLEETKLHFVVCEANPADPDPRVAREVWSTMDESRVALSDWEKAFVSQQSSWLNDLTALAVCTRSANPSGDSA